ncbi:MAG: hypothetical protein FWE48_01085, partial [Coriobacteriia bacterium]|nr:hypothetical protein [Coriobacteriia bacterium]
ITGGASQWQSVSTGETHSLAVGTDGSLWAWGSNENGQLGIGASFVNFNAPQRITNSTTSWQSVSTGTLHSLAIDADGALWTWGTNDRGQLGKGVASAGAGQGTYNWLPWRVAASLMSTSSTDWTIPANATMPSNGAVGLGIGFSPVTIYFDRPMRTDVVGTIVIDNGGSVNVAGGVWSDSERGENTVFSASLRLFEFDTLHTATVSGFIDAAFGQIAANEMYPYTWTFTTEEDMSGQVGGGLPEGQIFFTENSCSTCHFTEDIVQEHALRANGCQTCHRYSITQKPKTNWSRVSSDLDLECKSEIAETGCMTCHGGTNNEIHSEQNKTVAHSLSFGTDTEDQRALRGCSGSGCHSATLDGMAGGFGFGDLDLASAHNDFWQAARDGRVSHACNIVPSMLGDANPYGCGLCHERTSNEKSRLRAPIASRLAQADVASNGLNCLTCHADSMNSSGSYSLKAFAQHNDLRVPVTMTQGLRVGGIPAPSAFSAIDLLAGLSPEMRVEFAGDLTHADDRLQPGVLQPAADELRLAQQQAAQHWLEHRRGSMGDFLSR